jgi:hypothetical protein
MEGPVPGRFCPQDLFSYWNERTRVNTRTSGVNSPLFHRLLDRRFRRIHCIREEDDTTGESVDSDSRNGNRREVAAKSLDESRMIRSYSPWGLR